MNSFLRLRVGYLLLVFATCSPRALAQSTLGAINGTVRDPLGAAVGGAALTLRNLDENTTTAAQTSPQGFYEFLNLKPGRYSVTAQKPGFAPATTPDIPLDARQTREADLTLPVATASQSVTVSAQVPLVDTEDGTLSDSKNFEELSRLPLNFRGSGSDSPLTAIITVPGVMQDRNRQLSLGGGLPGQVEVSVDGISVVNIGGVGGNLPAYGMTPSPEIIGEFKTTSVDNSAEFGQMGDISMITRGGTNQLHGSAFWYLQNRALDAKTWNSPFPNSPKVYNTLGGSLSGPVELPSIYRGRHRTFFFVDFENNHLPSSRLDQLLVPTASMRAGNLDGVPGLAAVDPLTGQPFSDNQIPPERINAVATALLSYYPLPNAPLHNNINYLHLSDTSSATTGYDTRIDHVLNSKQHLYARLTQKWSSTARDFGVLPAGSADTRDYNFVVSHAYTPNAAVSNEARFGFTRTASASHFPLLATDVVSKLGIAGLNLANLAGVGEFPAFSFNNGSSFSGVGVPRPAHSNSRIFQYADVLSWARGRHTMKFGGEVRRVAYHANQNGFDLGEYPFEDGAFSGNAFADLLLGLPAQSYYEALGPDADESALNAGFFAQDSWKIHRRFTLNYGLRWEVHAPFVDAHGNIAGFDHQTGSLIVPDNSIPLSPTFLSGINACSVAQTQPCTMVLKASQVGLPNSLRHTYYGDWDPRLAFAWQPWADGKTVIRGGFGRYTQSLLGGFAYAPTGTATSDTRTYHNYQKGMPPLFTFPSASPPLSNLGVPSGIESFSVGMDPNFRDPYSFQWNFTVEHELPRSTLLRGSYIGSQSVGMPVIANYNQVPASTAPWSQSGVPFPLWGGLYSLEPIGFAHYEAMQLEASHRFRNDLFFQGSYVLGKNLGEVGAPFLFGGGALPTEYSGNALSSISDRFNTSYDRGELPGSRRNTFLLTALYPLPFGKGRAFGSNWRGLMQGGLGGWELSTVTLLESGTYLTPTINSNFDQSNTIFNVRATPARPDRVGNGNLPDQVNHQIWDLSAFVAPPVGAGRFGNSGAGVLEGPGTIAIAGGLAKAFAVTERLHLRIEATFTNVPNHPNFLPPSTNISAPSSFGKVTSVQGAQNAGNRTGQLGLRFDF